MSGREISSQHVAQLSAADDGSYWWYRVRRAHVEAGLRAAGLDASGAFLDFGCGAGGMLDDVIESFAPAQALGLDGTQEAVDIAVSRGLPAQFADFRAPLDLPFAPTAITTLDVLEHLEDPVLALGHLRDASAPGARLVVSVPSMPSLFSKWDEVCGHFRRYDRATVREHLRAGGWELLRLRYAFSYCVPPAWWQRRVTKQVQEMEFPPVSSLMNGLLTSAGALERWVGCPMPFGTSLIAWARRRD